MLKYRQNFLGECGSWVGQIMLLLFVLLPGLANAANINSVANGNWSSASTWSTGTVPTSADDVIIEGGHTVTVDISNAVCSTLQIGDLVKANATLSFTSGSQLTVNGTVIFGGNGNALRNGALDMAYGGKLICTDLQVQNFSSFTSGQGTIELTGTSTLPSEFSDFHNLTINGGTLTLQSAIVVTGTLGLASGTLSAGNYLTMSNNAVINRSEGSMTGQIQSTNQYDIYYSGSSKTIGPERSGTGLRSITVNTAGQTITQDTILSITGLTVTAGTYFTSTYNLSLSGNLAVNGVLSGSGNVYLTGSNTTISGTGSVTSSTAITLQSGNKTISSGSNLNFSNEIAISGAVTVTNYGTVTSTSNAGITGTVIGSSWQNAENSVLNISGPLLQTGNLIALGTGNTINYNSTASSQNIKAGTYYNLSINKSSQVASLAGNTTVNGNLTLTSGTLDVTTGNYSITLKGNFSNNGTFTCRSGSLILTGTSAQTISGTNTFYNFTLNNASGILLSGGATINGALTFSSGKITTGSNKIIISSTGSISGAATGKYIYGTLEKYFGTGSNISKTFEIGNTGSYLPVNLTFSSITNAGYISATLNSGDHPQINSGCVSASGNVNSYWTLSNSGVSPVNFSATFNFSSNDYDAGASPASFKLSSYNGGWSNHTISSAQNTSTTATGITNFGDFAVGQYNPKIYNQPVNASVCAGDNLSFTIVSSGSGISYQWQESTNGGSTWQAISNSGIYGGATTSTLSITGVTSGMHNNLYRCIATTTSPCANADTSSAASIIIASSFSITGQPVSANVCTGNNTGFTVTASGAISGYYWQVNSGSGWSTLSNGGIYSNATSATLNLTGVTNGYDGYQYRCIITSNCGPNDTTSAATLSLLTAPSIGSHPSNITQCEGTNANFSVTASGSNLTYQWQESTNGGSAWQALFNGGIYGGTTTSTLTLTSVPYANNTFQYRCIVSGSCTPPVTSNAATLNLNKKPYVTSQPASVTVQYNTNRNATFTATGNGSGTITYQWQENTGTGWTDITNTGVYSGATTSNLSITNATIGMDSYRYRCVISGSCSPADTSDEAYLYISFNFTITTNTNWSSLSPTPTTTSTIEVKGGATLTVDVNNAVCANIQLGRKPNPNGGDGTLSFNSGSQLSVLGPGRNVFLGDQNRTGNIIMTSGGKLVCNGFVTDNLGTWSPGSGTVEFTGIQTIPANFSSFNNLTVNSTMVTLAVNTTLTGDLKIDSSGNLNTSTYTLSVPGNFILNGTLSGTGATTFSGNGTTISGSGSVTNTSTLTLSANKSISAGSNIWFGGTVALNSGVSVTNYGTVTSAAGGGITGASSTSEWINATNSVIKITGPLLATGTLNASATGNTVTYNSTSGAQTVKAVTYHNLEINNTGQTATLSGAATVNGTLTLTNGTFATGTNLIMGSGSIIQRSGGEISGTLQGSNIYDVNYTGNSKTSNAELGGTGLRNVNIGLNLGETLYLDRNLSPTGNLNINSGTLDITSNNFSITLKANFTNADSFIAQGGTVILNGTNAQTLSGNTTFHNLTLNNSAGATLSGGDATVNGTLTFSSGKITTDSNKLVITQTGNINGAGTGKYIYGTLQKYFGTGSNISKTFEVGNSGSYFPVSYNFSDITNAGSLTVSTVNADHPQISSSCLNASKSVNRYWSVANNSLAFSTYSATINFLASDIDAGADTSKLRLAVYYSGWNNPSPSTRTATTTSATGITVIGDLQAGEPTPINISSEPVNVAVCVGANGNFTVTATGSGLTYQWQLSLDSGGSWNNISNNATSSGSATNALSITSAATQMSGYMYRCVINASCAENDTTQAATLQVYNNGYWVGATSSSWLTSANWCGGVPTYTSNIYIPANAQNMPQTGRIDSVNNVHIQAGASLTLTADLSIFGDLDIWGTLNVGSHTLTIYGEVSGTGTINSTALSNLVIKGSGNAVNITASTWNNITVNRTGGAELAGDVIVNGTLTLSSGTLTVGSNKLVLNGSEIAGTVSNLNAGDSSTLEIGGNASNRTIPSSVSSLRKLIVNNSNDVKFMSGLTISDSLVFSSGRLTLGNYDLNISTGVITGFDSTKYLVTQDSATAGGKLIRTVNNNNTNVFFPVGTYARYAPVKLKLTANSTTDQFGVRVFNKMLKDGTGGTQLSSNVVNHTWMIDENTPGGSDATVELAWLTSSHAQTFSLSNCGVAHYTGGKWSTASSWGSATLTNGVYWQSRSGITSFSPFGITDNNLEIELQLTLKVYMHGAYNQATSYMYTTLNSKGLIPATQPYSSAPYNYPGNETVASIPNADVVDWVLVQLRNSATAAGADSNTIGATKAGFLLKNGSITGLDAATPLVFNVTPAGNYYVVVYHRTHLPVMSSEAVTVNNFNYDFTDTSTKAYGGADAQEFIGNGIYGMVCGRAENTYQPFEIDTADRTAAWLDRNSAGYYFTDCNLDGVVDATDRSMILNHLQRTSQVP